MKYNNKNNPGLWNWFKFCYLAILRTYQLMSYNTNTTQFLAVVSNFFYILWLISFTALINIYLSTLGAKDFQTIIKKRYVEIRREPSTLEQAWLIPQSGRNTWGDFREFNKVSLVSQIIGT